MVPFESLGTISYSSSIVTMAVSLTISGIFSVKNVTGNGHSRSFKMVPFESLGTISYSSSIVTMAVSLTISGIFSVKNGMTLKSGFGVVQGH